MGTIRMSGMISGLDTDAIVKELVSAQRLKNKKVSDKLTLSEWKEEKWKELNTKLLNLYKNQLSNIRFQSSYQTKKVTSSNTNFIEVIASANAPVGSHTISIEQLASSQYVTGGQLDKYVSGTTKEITSSTTLKELWGNDFKDDTVIQVSYNNKKINLVVNNKTTINDFVNTCKELGLNASFDTTQRRLFISSKDSGIANAFTIQTGTVNSDAKQAYANICSILGLDSLSSASKATVSKALSTLEGTDTEELKELYDMAVNGESSKDSVKNGKIDALKTLINFAKNEANTKAVADEKDAIKQDILEKAAGSTDDEKIDSVVREYLIEQKAKALGRDLNDDEIKEIEEEIKKLASSSKESILNTVVNNAYNSDTEAQKRVEDYVNAKVAELKGEVVNYVNNVKDLVPDGTRSGALTALGLGEIDGTEQLPADNDANRDKKMTVIAAADARVKLDGATITANTNTISVNGMTLNLKNTTAVGETVSLNVSNDTQAVYDMVKEFINSYNAILKEMNELYYAASARGYDPLSDDEKNAMSEKEIEKWENKIKSAILRRDSTLGNVITAMKNAMMSTVEVNGSNYSLASFGIQTSTDYTERGLLHIYGNKDDSTYADKEDKLLKALNEDPETVTKALSGIFQNLYDTMREKMSGIANVRSVNSFYNDKLLDKEQAEYKKRIATLEDKLADMEDKYYKQFSAMETALARLQSQSNALAGLLGTSSR